MLFSDTTTVLLLDLALSFESLKIKYWRLEIQRKKNGDSKIPKVCFPRRGYSVEELIFQRPVEIRFKLFLFFPPSEQLWGRGPGEGDRKGSHTVDGGAWLVPGSHTPNQLNSSWQQKVFNRSEFLPLAIKIQMQKKPQFHAKKPSDIVNFLQNLN